MGNLGFIGNVGAVGRSIQTPSSTQSIERDPTVERLRRSPNASALGEA